MTSKEISQRLKEVGFEASTEYAWRQDSRFSGFPYPEGNDVELLETYSLTNTSSLQPHNRRNLDYIPAYDAEILFKWLRPYGNTRDMGWFINHNEIVVSLHEGRDGVFEFKTSLADMLGEAIIWIKEQ